MKIMMQINLLSNKNSQSFALDCLLIVWLIWLIWASTAFITIFLSLKQLGRRDWVEGRNKSISLRFLGAALQCGRNRADSTIQNRAVHLFKLHPGQGSRSEWVWVPKYSESLDEPNTFFQWLIQFETNIARNYAPMVALLLNNARCYRNLDTLPILLHVEVLFLAKNLYIPYSASKHCNNRMPDASLSSPTIRAGNWFNRRQQHWNLCSTTYSSESNMWVKFGYDYWRV